VGDDLTRRRYSRGGRGGCTGDHRPDRGVPRRAAGQRRDRPHADSVGGLAALAHGTSTVLVATIEAAAVSRGCVRIMLNNLIGARSFQRGFYAQLGYHHRADVANFVKRLR
jgi:hypothetical protein